MGCSFNQIFSVTSNRLWKDFISVGRVQTPTLALIVKREEEIQNFIPEKYYQISVKFNKKIDFTARYEKDIKDKSEAESILMT